MSQEQLERPQEPIKYGDVFSSVEGQLAAKAVPPGDAEMMQTAEDALMGQTERGGAAAVMQSAARKNEKAGFVGHEDTTDEAGDVGVTVSETDSAATGNRLITESVGGQVVGQIRHRVPLFSMTPGTITPGSATFQMGGNDGGGITIGEALEATALTAGHKPVEWSDAAAIQAAEVRATGRTTISPGGVAAAAQSAATHNARTTRIEDMTKLADILTDATLKLPADRPATRKDAEGVTGAEMRNDPYMTTHPAGVAASVAAAARLNEQGNTNNKQ